jgi:hypothetical protein
MFTKKNVGMEELKHLLQIDLMDNMPINKKNLSRALEELNKKGENLTIEKYEGSFGVSKDFSGLMSVRAVIDLESGKIRTQSSMGLITIVIIARYNRSIDSHTLWFNPCCGTLLFWSETSI